MPVGHWFLTIQVFYSSLLHGFIKGKFLLKLTEKMKINHFIIHITFHPMSIIILAKLTSQAILYNVHLKILHYTPMITSLLRDQIKMRNHNDVNLNQPPTGSCIPSGIVLVACCTSMSPDEYDVTSCAKSLADSGETGVVNSADLSSASAVSSGGGGGKSWSELGYTSKYWKK